MWHDIDRTEEAVLREPVKWGPPLRVGYETMTMSSQFLKLTPSFSMCDCKKKKRKINF